MGGIRPVLSACVLWMQFCSVAAAESTLCYVLDGLLFFYGIILTILYFRIRKIFFEEQKAPPATKKEKMPLEEGIYTGLNHCTPDTYETVGTKNSFKK